jgi:Tfp pilus assembly protein PilN
MATTLMPLDPATSPQRANRVLTISARLLPAEIVAARRARKIRAAVIVCLVLVVGVLGSWYAYATYQTAMARDDLAGVTADAQVLRQRQAQYADVVDVQAETTALEKQLATLQKQDLRWSKVLRSLSNAGAPSDIVISGIDAQLAGKAETGGVTLPSTATGTVIGSITVTGTAPSKPELATYIEALGKLKVVANPYLTTTTKVPNAKAVDFSLKIDVMSEALGGRFTEKKAGGK